MLLAIVAASVGVATIRAEQADPSPIRPGMDVLVDVDRRADGTLTADGIERRDASEGDEEIRGPIEAVEEGGTRLRMLGLTILVGDDVPVLLPGDAPGRRGDLVPGKRVKIDGRLESPGVFRARQVRVREGVGGTYKIAGRIESVVPASGGTLVIRVLGLDIAVDAATDWADRGGAVLASLQRGTIDDDDLRIADARAISRRLRAAGEVRLALEVLGNPDADPETRDDRAVPELKGIAGLALDLGAVQAYAEVEGYREIFVRGGDPLGLPGSERSQLAVSQAYVAIPQRGSWPVTLYVGRQQFRESRQWLFSQKFLDGVRVVHERGQLRIDVSISRNVFDEQSFPVQRQKTNVIADVTWRPVRGVEGSLIFVERRDRSRVSDSPTTLVARILARPGRYVEAWADAAVQRGTRGRTDGTTQTLLVRDVRARAFDAGLTLRPRVRLDPTLTVSYASATGDAADRPGALIDPRAADRTFRQGGLQRNRGKFNGNVTFRYYGEVLDPELANLAIATLATGIRPVRAFSADLVWHRYRQDVPSRKIHGAEIDGDPSGVDPNVGDEWDLVLGYEPGRAFELRLTLGVFRPGTAFDAHRSDVRRLSLQAKFRV